MTLDDTGAGICQLPHRNQPDQPRRAINGTRTCHGCRNDLERILAGEDRFNNGERTRTPGLPELWLELETILPASRTPSGVAVSGSREAQLPFAPLVSVHRALIRDQLCSWAAYQAELRNETGPRNADPDVVARWLAAPGRLDWATEQDWVVDYAAELRNLRSRSWSLLDPVRRSRFDVAWCVGTPSTENCPCACHSGGAYRKPCDVKGGCGSDPALHLVPCDGVLGADIVYNDEMLPPLIYCSNPECGAEWPPHRWVELGRVTRRRKREQNGDAA